MSEDSPTRSPGLLKEIATFIIVAALLFGGYATVQYVLGTRYPLLVVDGPSMLPTLREGDYVVIKRVAPSEIRVGDIIVFHSPHDSSKLIIHRVHEIVSGNPLRVKTKGDNNITPDPWVVDYSMIEGKVIFVIPVLGHVTLFLKNPYNLALVVLFFIVLFGLGSLKRVPRQPPASGGGAKRLLGDSGCRGENFIKPYSTAGVAK